MGFDKEDEEALQGMIDAEDEFSPAFKKVKEFKELVEKLSTTKQEDKEELIEKINKVREEAKELHDKALHLVKAVIDINRNKGIKDLMEEKIMKVSKKKQIRGVR